MLVPVALVGQAVATAALPTLARYVAEGRREELDAPGEPLAPGEPRARRAARRAGSSRWRRRPCAFVYVRGAFTPADAAPVVEALRVFACGVPGWIVQTLAVRPFYARGQMWRPMGARDGRLARGAPALRRCSARASAARASRSRARSRSSASALVTLALRAPLARRARARCAARDRRSARSRRAAPAAVGWPRWVARVSRARGAARSLRRSRSPRAASPSPRGAAARLLARRRADARRARARRAALRRRR